MYQIEDKNHIDIAAEIKAMAEFVGARWTNVDGVEQLLQAIADMAKTSAVGSISSYPLSTFLEEQRKQRKAAMRQFSEDASLLSYYDQVYCLFDSLSSHVLAVEFNGREMLSEAYREAAKSLDKLLKSEEFKHLKKAEPIGFKKMVKHYQSGDAAWGKALSDEGSDRFAFNGADLDAETNGGFVFKASLIGTVQQKAVHNEAPYKGLVYGAYNHFVALYKHINTRAVIADLNQLAPLVQVQKPVFNLEFAPQQALTKALFALADEDWRGSSDENPEQEYLQELADKKAQKPLSPEEIEANRANAFAMVSNLFKSKTKLESKQAEKERKERVSREQRTIRDILNAQV